MIARMKVLGLRAANGGTLRMAARGIVSYLQGGDEEAAADTKQAARRSRPGVLDGAESDESRSSGGVLGYYMAGAGGRSQGRARGRGAASMGLSGRVSGPELEAVLMGRHAAVRRDAAGGVGVLGAGCGGGRGGARGGSARRSR